MTRQEDRLMALVLLLFAISGLFASCLMGQP